MTYIRRALESVVVERSKQWPVILLTGARQTGKTTMLRKLAEEENMGRQYVTLDDYENRTIAHENPRGFLKLFPPPVIIDEVQYAPNLFSYIKMHVDEQQNPGDFWLTGSQVFHLMDGVQESLAGRVCLLTMAPLSQAEMIGVPTEPFEPDFARLTKRARERKALSIAELYERIYTGGMPSVISGQRGPLADVYDSFVKTHLERDVAHIIGNFDLGSFNRFLSTLAALTGQMLNYKTVADHAEIDQRTAKAWIHVLERLGIIFLLQPYANNALKRMVSTPKFYFSDTGLAVHLTRWPDSTSLERGIMSGAILENFAVAEIMKSYQNKGQVLYLYYYRDKDAREIDLILEKNRMLHPLEIKRTASPTKKMTRTFTALDRATIPRSTGAVLSTTDRLLFLDEQNLIVPIWMI